MVGTPSGCILSCLSKGRLRAGRRRAGRADRAQGSRSCRAGRAPSGGQTAGELARRGEGPGAVQVPARHLGALTVPVHRRYQSPSPETYARTSATLHQEVAAAVRVMRTNRIGLPGRSTVVNCPAPCPSATTVAQFRPSVLAWTE